MQGAEVIGLWVELERGPFLEDRTHLRKMLDVMERLGGLIPLGMGIGVPQWRLEGTDRQVWASALVIRQDAARGYHFNKEKLIAQARLLLIWVFGGDDHGADLLWLPKFMPKDRGVGSHVPLLQAASF